MADAQNIAARCARDLAEINAKLVSLSATKVVVSSKGSTQDSIRLTRKWERIDDGLRANYEAYLRANEYVTDPMADEEKRTGRWKVLRVFSSPLKTAQQEQGIYQVLLYWPEGYGAFGNYCEESSPLAHTDTQVFVDSPTLVTCAHQIAEGKIFTASNRLDPETGLWSGELKEDESRAFGPKSTFSGSAAEVVEKIDSVNRATAPYLTAATVDVTGKIISSSLGINRYGRLDTTVSIETGKKQVTTEKVIAKSYEETTEQKTYQATQEPDPTFEAGYVKTVRNEASKYPRMWNVMKRIKRILRIDTAVRYDAEDDASNHAVVEESIGQPNVSGGLAVVLTAGAGESLQASVQYDKESDTLDLKKVVQTGKEQTNVTRSASASSDEVITEKTYQDSALPAPTAEDGKVKQLRSVMSKFTGKYDTSESIRTVKKLEAVARGGGPLTTEETTVTVNADADTSGTAAGADGEIVDSSARKNEVGKFDIVVSKKTAVEKTATHTSGGGLSSDVVTITRNGSIPAPGTGGAGIITDVSASINEYGKIDSTASVRTAKAASGSSVSGGPLVTVTEEFARNASTPVSPGAGSIGTIRSASNTINEFGLFDTGVSTQVAVASPVITSVHGGPLVRVETQECKNSTAQSTGSSGSGVITTISQGVNQFGKVDWQKTTQTAIPSPVLTAISGGPLVRVETQEQKNGELQTPGQGDIGTIIGIEQNTNQFGKVDWAKTVQTAITPPSISSVSGSPMVRIETTEQKNGIARSPGQGSIGTIIRVEQTLNQFGKVDWSETIQTATQGQDSGWIPYQDRYGTSYFRAFKNMTFVPTSGFTDKTSNSLYASKNEYGLWDGSASMSAVRDNSGGSTDPDVEVNYDITINGTTYKIKEKITGSLTRAQAHVAGNNTGGAGKTPGIVYIGHGKYKATSVLI